MNESNDMEIRVETTDEAVMAEDPAKVQAERDEYRRRCTNMDLEIRDLRERLEMTSEEQRRFRAGCEFMAREMESTEERVDRLRRENGKLMELIGMEESREPDICVSAIHICGMITRLKSELEWSRKRLWEYAAGEAE